MRIIYNYKQNKLRAVKGENYQKEDLVVNFFLGRLTA